MFEQLIQISEHRKRLETLLRKQKSDFVDSLALQQAQLDDLTEQEKKLREEALLLLEKENKTSEKVGNKTIIKQIKKTLKVADIDKLYLHLENVKVEDYGFDKEKVKYAFDSEPIIKDKFMINSLVDAYEKVEGKLLDGVELIETKFLTIK